jgi:hypothetical protein
MRKRIFKLTIFIFICIIISAYAQPNLPSTTKPAEVPDKDKILMNSLLPKTIDGWKIVEPGQYFDRRTIFDYMDGAGELYRSYSYRELLVQQYKSEQVAEPVITVELFDMGSSADAFGIFSFEQMDEPVGVGQGSEYGSGLLRFWKNQYFINIYTENETDITKQTSLALGKNIATAIPENGTIPKLVSFLPQEGLMVRSIRYFHLQSGLNHHYNLADKNVLNLDSTTNAILAKYQFASEKPYILLIQYSSQTAAISAFYNFLEFCNRKGTITNMKELTVFSRTKEGKWIVVKKEREKEYLYLILSAESKPIAEKLITAIKPIYN